MMDVIEEGLVVMQKIPTKDNPVDMITKSVPTTKFKHCMDLIVVMSRRSP